MISVTGYDRNGDPRVFGRHPDSELIAWRRAEEYAAKFISEYPIYGPITFWTFKLDTADRQLFQRGKPL